MSIVIATLEENESINLFADRRLVIENESGSFSISGETKKIFKLSETISCAITGDAEWGNSLRNELQNIDFTASQLIQFIENYNRAFKEHSTFILVGKYDDGKLFYYGFQTENKIGGINFHTNALMVTSPIEHLYNCQDFYLDLKDAGYSNAQGAIETIKFASRQNPKYISEVYDHIQINL